MNLYDVIGKGNYATTIEMNGKTWYVGKNWGTYTYSLNDNKVYIPMKMNGEILTLSGNTLIKDGSTDVFTNL